MPFAPLHLSISALTVNFFILLSHRLNFSFKFFIRLLWFITLFLSTRHFRHCVDVTSLGAFLTFTLFAGGIYLRASHLIVEIVLVCEWVRAVFSIGFGKT